jgi:hypothetical protein
MMVTMMMMMMRRLSDDDERRVQNGDVTCHLKLDDLMMMM